MRLPPIIDHPSAYVPRVDYAALEHVDENSKHVDPPEGMVLYPLAVSGPRDSRFNLMFFSDGYTRSEETKFLADARKLTADIVSPSGAMSHVSQLINVWGVFVPSPLSGIGNHDTPLPGAPFGLYRPGPELRAVYVAHPNRARAACKFWREGGDGIEGGCDQGVLLGNDALYGGLGGEFTVITASELNGPLVLRHELGHSLIPVGEEYEGGFAYFGANSDKVKHVEHLKWAPFLTDPIGIRIEDVRVPLQVYPWHDLGASSYKVTFASSSEPRSDAGRKAHAYPRAMLRASLSSIPYPSHITLTLNGHALDLSPAFPENWAGSHDRRWIEVPLPSGLKHGLTSSRHGKTDRVLNVVEVELTEEGQRSPPGQGGKMITSLEMLEYAAGFNDTEGFIGAFPTYAMDGSVTLRPTNEECLMRKVNHPTFCPVCAEALERSLEDAIANKQRYGRNSS